MLESLFLKIQTALDKMVAESNRKEDKGKQILLSNEMEAAILEWSDIYNDHPMWLNSKEGVTTMGLGGSISSELARLTTIELDSHITGGELADVLDPYYQELLNQIRVFTEYGCAKGGCVFKPYFTGNGLAIECVQADAFYPTSFDSSGNISGAIFAEQIRRNKRIFTRVEWHEIIGGSYHIVNKAFSSSDEAVLGHEIRLNAVDEWEAIEPEATLSGVNIPLFGYFKVPQANKIDNRSPIGVSVFAKAVNDIRHADEQYSRLLREYQITEPAIFIDESMVKRDSYGNPIAPKAYERIYQIVQGNNGVSDNDFFREWLPGIRDQSLLNGLDSILKRIEFNCGLAYGTISDPNTVEMTATQINAAKQRSYATVSDLQRSLRKSLEDTINAMTIYAGIYDLAPYSEYEVSFNFDDSIVKDKREEQAMQFQEVTSGILDPVQYLMKRYGVDAETAREMMPKNEAAQQASDMIDQYLKLQGAE